MTQITTWQCRNCGRQIKSTLPPSPQGGNSCTNNPPSKNHVWEKLG